ncbi:hypothetical protein SH661x_002262 [Planctomicrobium sp. SH661]|uniref:hypothetical protein n=1 Tax=Planctomicrobium sp. SH661 TaxID=3448124 RepID=UPI003F5C084D
MLFSRRCWILAGCQVVISSALSGCGTLLYPERRGQAAGRLDWKVVALDGIGLLFFFIPGVIAFAVDFLNGTIYLPAETTPCEPPCLPTPTSGKSRGKTSQLQPIKVPRSQLTPGGIEKIIAQRAGKTISLEDGKYVTRPMNTIDEFWKTRDELDTHSLGRGAGIS